MVKNLPQEMWVASLGWKIPGEGNDNLLQYFRLGNPMGRGTCWATVHEVTEESDVTYRLNSPLYYQITNLGLSKSSKFLYLSACWNTSW